VTIWWTRYTNLGWQRDLDHHGRRNTASICGCIFDLITSLLSSSDNDAACVGISTRPIRVPRAVKRASSRVDVAFGVGSLVAALRQGLILGGLMQGDRPEPAFHRKCSRYLSSSTHSQWHHLLFGYAVPGGGWLKLKSNVSLQHFASHSRRISAPAFAVFFGIACIYAVRIQPGIRSQWASHGITLAFLVGLFAIAAGTLTALPEKSRPVLPFLLGLLLFVVGISGIAFIVFPEIVPFSVSLWDAASSSTSQRLVMIGAACVTPVVLAYSAFAYWIFRGKTPENRWEA